MIMATNPRASKRKSSRKKIGRPKGSKTSPTSPRTIAAVKKRADAVELRLQGWPFAAIGEALGVSAGRAFQLVSEGLDDILLEPADKLRAVEIARCDAMMTGVFPGAVNGDHASIASVLAISARRDKLLGLDTPTRVRFEGEVNHQHGGTVQHAMEIVFVTANHPEPIDITPKISEGSDITP